MEVGPLNRKPFQAVEAKLAAAVGGFARLRVITLLALVLGLDSANNGTVGAIVVPLKQSFHISNTQVGLLITLSGLVGALATLPCGVLTDHVNRTRMLWISIVTWSVTMALSGAANGYVWLLVCRIALGAVVAVAGPVVASLIGDFFAPHERGRIYGYVLAGEMIGAAMGLLVSGTLADVTWRLGFWWLAALGMALAVLVAKMLPEPVRGGRSRIPIGATEIPDAASSPAPQPSSPETPEASGQEDRDSAVVQAVSAQHVQPHASLVLHENPQRRSLWWATRYVLSIRTNVVLIVASALGYFFLTGLGTFGVAMLRGRFGLGQFVATLLIGVIGTGALIGVLTTGRIADWLVGRGHITARITVGGVMMLTTASFAVPALLSHALVATVGFAFVAAIGLGGANPPLDAARLDIMHSRLWGRAEAVRTLLRSAFTALAPVLFGYVSTQLGGPSSGQVGESGTLNQAAAQSAAATGLDHTFLIMLAPLFVSAGLILFMARRTYPRDVATAVASEQAG